VFGPEKSAAALHQGVGLGELVHAVLSKVNETGCSGLYAANDKRASGS
jgi:hypothetical protein